ncbi:protein RGF1 INDUCIBLE TRANSCRIPTION FACTOR 1-like [Hevea brasiliensis]|uniref:protein RGF1 INDUCIBLE TRANSCRIPTION FACTOR 1-like n=1 Tax=Hevea brasiliensis TaxID=3981 RepID=UPI0025F45231|nr:protein RGF1 INDUCIBLE TRANSCRIPTION FACTOR 1-like [Hevea brasiliensis]
MGNSNFQHHFFFGTCMFHPSVKKNGLDRFCIDCLSSLCSNRVPAHAHHQLIKIRRYIYNDVVNLQDLLEKNIETEPEESSQGQQATRLRYRD